MAQFTLIIDTETGAIIGGAHGHVGHGPGMPAGAKGGLLAGPGQTIAHIDIPDDLVSISEPNDFYARLKRHLGK